jgi:hypothetical protein
MRACDVADVGDRLAAKLQWSRHAPARHDQFALTIHAVAHDRRELVGRTKAVFGHDVVVASPIPVAQLARAMRADLAYVGRPHRAGSNKADTLRGIVTRAGGPSAFATMALRPRASLSDRRPPRPATRGDQRTNARTASMFHVVVATNMHAIAEAAGVSLVASEARPGRLPLRRAFCSRPRLPYIQACCGRLPDPRPKAAARRAALGVLRAPRPPAVWVKPITAASPYPGGPFGRSETRRSDRAYSRGRPARDRFVTADAG